MATTKECCRSIGRLIPSQNLIDSSVMGVPELDRLPKPKRDRLRGANKGGGVTKTRCKCKRKNQEGEEGMS